jgi:hypothetical protein
MPATSRRCFPGDNAGRRPDKPSGLDRPRGGRHTLADDRFYDVFNGDADGICALLQLRREEPAPPPSLPASSAISQLLERVPDTATRVTVLDVSLDKNRDALQRLLDAGAEVFYCDHHFAGEIPEHPALEVSINTAPEVCTSLLVNGRLGGAHAAWAVVGAFGDNLDAQRRGAGEDPGPGS